MPRIKGIDVNMDAFKGIKSLGELKKEPGRIFGHLPQDEENAAYDELGAELGLKTAASKTVEAQPQPATSGQ
jgi:hypothetical protein